MSRWLPIETAPRDGTTVLVCKRDPSFGWIRGYARFEMSGRFGGWISHGFVDPPGNLGLAYPSRWMPIPDTPDD